MLAILFLLLDLIYTTCKMMYTGAVAYINAHFGASTGPIHISNVQCSGSESGLVNCSYTSPSVNCGHSDDAGVMCEGNNPVLCWK